MNRPLNPAPAPALLAVLAAVALSSSGCTLLGAGAATVGGCALLDRDNDSAVTDAELSAGIFDRWDTDDDGRLTEAEFNAGVRSREVFAGWERNHSDWDSDDNGVLTQAEFAAGAEGGMSGWADRRCDDLGL